MRFITGIVIVPAVSTLLTIEPDIMPSMALAKMQTLAAPPRNVPHSANETLMKNLPGAGHHERGAEDEKADHRLGERLERDAEETLDREHVIGARLLGRRLRAFERPEPRASANSG